MIVLVSWILIFLGIFFIFKIIVPIPAFPGGVGLWMTSILKASLSVVLTIFWIVIMLKMRNFLLKRKLIP
jgi:hypothetical protein